MDRDKRDDWKDPDELLPDRFYVSSDAGSFYLDDEHPDGFETAATAAEWARDSRSGSTAPSSTSPTA